MKGTGDGTLTAVHKAAFHRSAQPKWLAIIIVLWALDHTGALTVTVNLDSLSWLGRFATVGKGVTEVLVMLGGAYAAYRGIVENRRYRNERSE